MKRAWMYLLALCLLAGFITITAPQAMAVEHTYHCVCGGHADGIGDHVCGQTVTWEPWDGTAALEDGHSYYLNDTDGDGVITLSETLKIEKKHVNLCLNGVELTCTSRTLQVNGVKVNDTYVPAGLSICDCNEEAQWGSVTSTSTGIAPVLHSFTSSRGDVTINLYSGNLTAKDADISTKNAAAGVFRLGNNTKESGNEIHHTGTFNMYGGNVSGGMTTDNGGNLYVSIDCYFNMYGGTITGGRTAGNGGNLFVSGHLNMQGGRISGGSATGVGGGIYLSGKANEKATVTIGGTAQVTDNTGSNIFLPEDKLINISTLEKPARIGVFPANHEFFAYTINQSDARFFFSDIASSGVVFDNGGLKLASHDHCICGGSAVGVGNHSCVELNWTALSYALREKGMTADTVDFGKLPAGHYFLDADVTVIGTTNISKDISLCLNGYSISREEGKIFGYLKNLHTLNICDCSGVQDADGSWNWQGYINGGSHTYGSVIYTHFGSSLNIYGGNFTGKGTSNGGVIVVANDGCGDLNSDGKTDDTDKKLAEPAVMNLYNGAIYGSQYATSNSTVTAYHTAVVNQYGGRLYGGMVNGKQEVAMILEETRLLSGSYSSLAAALKKVADGQYIRLIADCQEDVTISGTVYLDLNGHNLSGITVTGTLYAFDSAVRKGVLSCSGKPADQCTLAGASYMTVPVEGGYSFYGFQAVINKISMKPDTAAMGYKAKYDTDPMLRDKIQSFGYKLWIREDVVVTRSMAAGEFTPGRELTLRLNNILKTDNDFLTNYNNADTQIYAQAFIRLTDGTTVHSAEVSYDLQQMLEMADFYYDSYTSAQKKALQKLYGSYESLMLGWDLPNLIHGDGSWIAVDAAALEDKLTYYGTFTLNGKEEPEYRIAAGKYILTEDLDLSKSQVDSETGQITRITPTIRIHKGDQVSICLNGHKLISDSRVFKVYGTLNICDCCRSDGTVTSSFAGSNNAFAPIAYVYSGTMNLYSGNLEATGQVTAAGVLAVGKSGNTSGTINIYGGTVSGGNTTSNSGLIALYDTSTVNMYGGKLYGGRTDGVGGAISVGNSSYAALYGGEIFGNTANNGGGVNITSGETQVYMGNRLVVRDNSAIAGGNVYHNSDTTVTIDGTTITGGTAEVGGGVYAAGASVKLAGDAVIRENQNGSLYVNVDSAFDTSGLTQGADVHLYNVSSMILDAHALLKYVTLEKTGYKTATIAGNLVLIPESFVIPADVEGFQVGFGRADITPTELGMPLAGYGNAAERLSKSIDKDAPLTVTTVAITDENGQTVLLMSVDLIRPSAALMDTILPAVSAATGVPESNIFTTFTHTHSVPETNQTTHLTIKRYNAMLPDRFAESANLAMADRAAATMEMGSFEVDGLNFTRHYQYEEDGIVKYFGDNFGTAVIDETTRHVTEADHTMHLVKFTREGKDILMANWRVHPHMTGGGSKYVVSSDIIGTTQSAFEQKSGMHFIYLQGAAGNINETSKLDAEKHGYDYKEYGDDLSNQMITALLSGCLSSAEVGTFQVDNYSYTATADIASDEEYNAAKAAKAAYDAWLAANPKATSAQKREKCEELGYLTWFHFNNVITRHGLDATYQLPLNVISLGDKLAFFTAPGELWDTVSMEIEAASPFEMTMCMGYSQDHYNYFVYDPTNGGEMTYESYESNNYRFVAPDTIQDMIAYWKQTLDKLYQNITD